ncbi:MAG: hypothetical protein PHI28_05450 [Mangrovibacterium sp.]|nr:hypothetical protein [Mangrovibacterium sp.]
MEDYIFILIAILLSVFGAVARKKKQVPVEDEEASIRRTPSVFDQLFEDPLFRDGQAPVKPPAPARPLREMYQPLSRKGTSPAGVTARVRRPQDVTPASDHPPGRRIHPLMKDFSLKKAVVYSEILQRKYS